VQNDVTLIHSENPSEKKRCEFCFKTTLLTKAKEMLLEQDKRGLGSSKHIIL
jgi:hypothetical protein